MKLSQEQLDVIDEYIDVEHIDKAKLIGYLEKHATIKNEVFKYCAKGKKKRSLFDDDYCIFLDNEAGYCPIDRDTFIRRIPFLFSLPTKDKPRSVWITSILPYKNATPSELEAFYKMLEHMYYDLEISLYDIFSYANVQTFLPPPPRKERDSGNNRNVFDVSGLSAAISSAMDREHELDGKTLFRWWMDYINICEKLGWTDFMPERFITRYNEALVAVNRKPIIYVPISEPFSRIYKNGNSYEFGGNFPCDENGIPILRWTSIRAVNPKSLTFDAAKSRCGTMTIELNPDSQLYMKYADEVWDDEGNVIDHEPIAWHQLYAGPQTMIFDCDAVKAIRLEQKMTQKEVADAIGASVRTYQKWEAGETTPDGHYLLRIMNWLNITDVQDIIKYTKPPIFEDDDTFSI